MKRALLSFAALVVVACNNPTGIGSPCTIDSDCDRGQVCFNEAGGFCSRGCSFEGTTRECPTGSVCTNTGASLVCAQVCQGPAECRDKYECAAVAASTVMACQPVKTK